MSRRFVVGALVLAVVAAAVAVFVPVGEESQPPWRQEVGDGELRTVAGLSGRVTAAQARETLAVLDPQSQLAPYVTLSATEALVRVFESDDAVVVPLASEKIQRPRPSGLAGMRILVDPGHFGGAWSELESRHVVQASGEPVKEGDLSWAVARLLQEQLTAAGAEVLLSRGPPPEQPFPHDLDAAFDPEHEAGILLAERLGRSPLSTYRRLYPSLYGSLMLLRARHDIVEELGLFKLYNRFDLRRRSALGSDVDLTLSIHFNTTGPRRDNWVMAFVPGNIMTGEAFTVSQRYWSIRRALDGHWPELVELGAEIMKAMKRNMDLPSLDPKLLAKVEEPKKVVVDVEQGVFARNLAIVRRTPGRVVLLEGPCVDNEAEYQRLQDRSVIVDGRGYPKRVQEYAAGVVEGLRAWLGE